MNLEKGVYEGYYNMYKIPKILFDEYFELFSSSIYENASINRRVSYIKNLESFSQGKAATHVLFLQQASFTGNTKTDFESYEVLAEKINTDFEYWGITEKNVIEEVSRNATMWDGFPLGAMLEYMTMEDGRVRSDHSILDGIIKPKSDPFWSTNYPPNDYNCRCSAKLVDKEPTDLNELKKERNVSSFVNKTNGFDVNWGEVDYVFPKSHTYMKTLRKYKVDAKSFTND